MTRFVSGVEDMRFSGFCVIRFVVDALVLVDYRFGGEEPAFDAQDNVQLLLVAPIKYPKAGRPGAAKLEVWVAKRRLASWKAVMTAARQNP